MSPDGAGGERIATPQLGDNVRVPRPYVGLRPYSELEHGLFFGRDRDAQLLVNKILSARLTLVYGASGVGKSSLVRARVAPDLRDEEIGDAEVVFFDGWGEPDAEAAIKREIATVIGSDAAGFSTREPLTTWAGLVNQVRRKPLILILDQFASRSDNTTWAGISARTRAASSLRNGSGFPARMRQNCSRAGPQPRRGQPDRSAAGPRAAA